MEDIWLRRFRRNVYPVLAKRVKPSRVILFGSRVAGRARKDSDLDVIVVSDDFARIPLVRRMGYLLNLLDGVHFPQHVDYLCYTPDEFARAQRTSSIVRHAMRKYLEVA
jgi:predicted nucleotidyltransferase